LAAPTNIFFTQFETTEGYNTTNDLVGQNSWVGDGSGGNGILTNFFTGEKQQAYVGFDPPGPGDDALYVWRPINFNPVGAGLPLVKFSVMMSIRDSSQNNTNYDRFRWSTYNQQGDRLFSVEFDNKYLDVVYQLDGTNDLFFTEIPFRNWTNYYTLAITMDFAFNRWSATLDQVSIATNQPITSVNAPLNLGDVDAVWLIGGTNGPGDNYMLFDNYRITAEALPAPPTPTAQMQFLGRTAQGWALLRTSGSDSTRWSVDATTNFLNWTPLITNTITSGYFDHVDMTAVPFSHRFYRARFVP
jgi:hypothetical protein